MFGHRRTELNEMVTNWKKSPNLSRSGSLRSPNLHEDNQEIEYPMNISPPLANNQLFRSSSTRSARKLPFFGRNNKHGIFNVNNNNDNNSQTNFVEEKPMKPVYINPKSDAVIINKSQNMKSPIMKSPNMSYSNNLLSPNLSPIQKERSPMILSPRMPYRQDDYTEQEIQERKSRRRSKSFSGYTNVINRSINNGYYQPPQMSPQMPSQMPSIPKQPSVLPKMPITPKRSNSLTRGRTPTREQNNSLIASARKAVQKVQQNQANSQQNSPIDDKPAPPPVVTGQVTLKRTQSLKASLQRWGVEHKKSQSTLSNPPTPTSPSSQNSIPPFPPLPSVNNTMPRSPSLSSDDGRVVSNWNHTNNLSRSNSVGHGSVNQNLSRQNSINQNLSRQNSINQNLSRQNSIGHNSINQNLSRQNSIGQKKFQ